MKTKYWAVILLAVLALSAVFSAPVFLPQSDARQAEIRSAGVLIRTVDLSLDQEFTVPCADGYNTVTVRDGMIAVTEATCPDHYCMKRGFVSGGTQIVCLPNRLVIRFTGSQEIDGSIG